MLELENGKVNRQAAITRSHLSVSIYLSLGGGRFTVNTFCPPNFLMMVIMMENGAVISRDRLCASLCQRRLSRAPAMRSDGAQLFPSSPLPKPRLSRRLRERGG